MISTHRTIPASHTRQWWLAGGIHPSQVVAAYQPKGAVDLAASYVNLANPGTYDATPIVAPTLDSNGWVFSGGTQCLDTGIIPGREWSMVIRLTGADAGILCGSLSGGDTRFFLGNNASGYRQYANGPLLVVSGVVSTGIMAICGANVYLNGSLDGTIDTGSLVSTRPIYIGAANNLGTVLAPIGSGTINGFAAFNFSLTDAQIAALSAAMAAL
jgi:hypothetical protein